MNLERRVAKLEQEGRSGLYPEGCICFPSEATLEMSAAEESAARAVPCPMHGDRLAATTITPPVYRAAWLKPYVPENPEPWQAQLDKAWRATKR